MEKTIRVGLIGYGMSGRVFHAPFLHTLPQYELVAVLERNRNDAVATYPYVDTVRTLDAMLERSDIDLVVVTTPNDTHYPYTMAALEAGKHVVVEKPFANTAAEAKEMVEKAETAKGVLSVYQNRRYVGDFATIRQLMAHNTLGKVHEYICHFDRYRTEPRNPTQAWREKPLPGSGVLYDLGSHLIDQVLCLFGMPAYLTAFIKKQRPFSVVDDYFELRFDYADGTTAIVKSGMLVREMGPRYAVHGTLGSYLKYGDDPQEELLKQGHMPVGELWGHEPAMQQGILHTAAEGGEAVKQYYPTLPGNYGNYYVNLYPALTGQGAPSEKAAHGYNTIRIIELAFESAAKQQTLPVTGLMDVGYPAL